MARLRMLLARLGGVFPSRRRDEELDEEVRAHLDLLADEHQRRGLSRADAERAARRDFGGVAHVKESYRDQRGVPSLETLAQDVRYGIRMWRRAPGFSAVVVAVLAIGIGANTAMFTIVDALLFRAMPGRADELVGLYSHDQTKPDSYRAFSYPNYADIRDGNDVFDGLLAHTFALVGLPVDDVTRRVFVEVVSSDFFSTIGVPLAAGRAFTLEEEQPGANAAVAIVGYPRWKDAGFNPAFIGSTVRVNARDFTVVGVAPEGFTGTTALITPELWLPLGVFETVVNDVFRNNGTGLGNRSNASLNVSGRLKPGVSVAAANARLQLLSKRLDEAYPAENRHQLLTVSPMSRVSISTEPSDDSGLAVFSAVLMPLSGAVLFIACLNIANMSLARGSARRKEMAIRLALGGGRRRLVRQLLTENFLLAFAGAAAGLLLGSWSMRLIVASMSPILPLKLQFDASPNVNVLIVTGAFAVLSTLVFGLAPALKISRPDVVTDLKDAGGDSTRPGRRFGARGWLVVAQIAISLVLLVAGGLFARVAMKAGVGDPGFRYDGLLLASVDPSLAAYDESRGRAAIRAVLERLRATPGVESAGMNSQIPFGEFHEGRPVERPGRTEPNGPRSATFTIVSADYFKTLGLRVLRGREFTRTEEESPIPSRVAIIDEPLARRLFPNEDPLGQSIRFAERGDGPGKPDDHAPMEIVGVVPGLRDRVTDAAPEAHVYVPSGSTYRAAMNLYVRVHGALTAEAEMLDDVRRAIRAVDTRLPVLDLITLRGFHDRGLLLWGLRAAGRTLTAFGLLALLLAAVGVYGVKSYLVSCRTREIGIRMALGARPGDILWLVLREGARTTTLGLLIGFPLALGVAVLLRGAIFGVSPFDPAVIVLAPAILVTAAALATYVPARRATRVTPLDALRAE